MSIELGEEHLIWAISFYGDQALRVASKVRELAQFWYYMEVYSMRLEFDLHIYISSVVYLESY